MKGFFQMELLGDRRVPVTNKTGRRLRVGEIIFAEGYIGSVRSRGDVPPGLDFEIETRSDVVIHTEQVIAGDDFKFGAQTIYFEPGKSGPGVFTVSKTPRGIPLRVIITDISDELTNGPAYIEFIPPYQNGDLKAEGEEK